MQLIKNITTEIFYILFSYMKSLKSGVYFPFKHISIWTLHVASAQVH